jgi:hypothetical protein
MDGLLSSFPLGLFSVILYMRPSHVICHMWVLYGLRPVSLKDVISLFICIFENPISHSLSPYRQM